MKREAVTTDHCISFVDLHGRHVVYDVVRAGPTECAECRLCIQTRSGHCPWGGPYHPSKGCSL